MRWDAMLRAIHRLEELTCSWLFKGRRSMSTARRSDEDAEYQKAVTALNGLQTSADSLDQRKEKLTHTDTPSLAVQRRLDENFHRKFEAKLLHMHEYLERSGMKLTDLNRLNAIHVTGTKGKGSVCAMCEIMLRKHNLKTGFFSSPHLLEVRERIRLNGKPLSKAKFVSYFWECYNKLQERKELQMPTYFKFLTIMSFLVFLKEKVDVAVVEVGIGGAYDCTNIILKPAVCAISSLGYDHMELLGETLEKIAWQKGGICKPGCPAFTSSQFPGPMRVLEEQASELKASSLHVAPPLFEYSLPDDASLKLGLGGDHQKANASLALQVCRSWLQGMGMWSKEADLDEGKVEKQHHGVPVARPFQITQEFRQGLEQCRWPGRNEIIKRGRITYYLDGAHTPQSLKGCADWFKSEALKESQEITGSVVSVLLFNVTKRRDPKLLLQALLDVGFQYAAFSPNIASSGGMNSADQTNLTVSVATQMASVHKNHQAWLQLHHLVQGGSDEITSALQKKREGLVTSAPHPQVLCGYSGNSLDFNEENALIFSCVSDFMKWLDHPGQTNNGFCNGSLPDHNDLSSHPSAELADADHVQVLITGSLHLVGATMGVLGCKTDDL